MPVSSSPAKRPSSSDACEPHADRARPVRAHARARRRAPRRSPCAARSRTRRAAARPARRALPPASPPRPRRQARSPGAPAAAGCEARLTPMPSTSQSSAPVRRRQQDSSRMPATFRPPTSTSLGHLQAHRRRFGQERTRRPRRRRARRRSPVAPPRPRRSAAAAAARDRDCPAARPTPARAARGPRSALAPRPACPPRRAGGGAALGLVIGAVDPLEAQQAVEGRQRREHPHPAKSAAATLSAPSTTRPG